MLAAGAASAVIVAGVVGTGGVAHAASSCGVLGLLCSGSSTPSPTDSSTGGSTTGGSTSGGSTTGGSSTGGAAPAPASSGSGSAGPLSSLLPSSGGKTLGGASSPDPASGDNSNKSGKVRNVKAASGLAAPSATAVLTAKSSSLTKLDFVGVATLPVGGGGSEKALELTASSADLSTVTISVTQDGSTVNTKTASLGFPQGMTLYTTKLCGQVEGVAPNICFTPDTASQIALKLASALGRVTPITMTNVTADQFVDIAPAAQWGALAMGTV